MNHVKSFFINHTPVGSVINLIDSVKTITPSNNKMMARNISAFKKSEEELCELLKNLDEQELIIQKTDNEMRKMQEIKETRKNVVNWPLAISVVGYPATCIASLSALVVTRRLAISNQVFGFGVLLVNSFSGLSATMSAQNTTSLEKGFGLAAIRIARLYEKVKTIQAEISSLKETIKLSADEFKNSESTLKQLEIAEKAFKKIADYYDELEKKSSRFSNGYVFDEEGLYSYNYDMATYENRHTNVMYRDGSRMELIFQQTGRVSETTYYQRNPRTETTYYAQQ